MTGIRVEIPRRGPLPKGEFWAKTDAGRDYSCRTCIHCAKPSHAPECDPCTYVLGAMPSKWERDPAKAMAGDAVPPVVGGLVDATGDGGPKALAGTPAQREAAVAQEEQWADDRALNAGVLGRAEHATRTAARRAKLRAAQGLPPIDEAAAWEVRNTVTVGDVCDYFGVPRPKGEPVDLEPTAKRIATALAAAFPHGLHVRDEAAFSRLVLLSLVMERAFRNFDHGPQ